MAMKLVQNSHHWGNHTTEFLAVGTAIKPLRGDHEIKSPHHGPRPGRLRQTKSVPVLSGNGRFG